jgi:hypothetical protein
MAVLSVGGEEGADKAMESAIPSICQSAPPPQIEHVNHDNECTPDRDSRPAYIVPTQFDGQTVILVPTQFDGQTVKLRSDG